MVRQVSWLALVSEFMTHREEVDNIGPNNSVTRKKTHLVILSRKPNSGRTEE